MAKTVQTAPMASLIGDAADNNQRRPTEKKNRGRVGSPAYPLLLLAIFVVWWIVLAIAPWYRQDWLLENVLVFIVVPLLIWSYRHLRFSNFSYSLIFIFLCLHEIGAHYTYAEVPYGVWFNRMTGLDINAALGFERNHFDRSVHFLYGFLILPACVEIFEARAKLIGFWRYLVPITFIMSHSELFEIIEWQAAEIFGGPLGQAYLGTQGDIWDAQKDSAAAMIGAISSTILFRLYLLLKIKFKRDHDRVEKSHV